jgi:hypothetical protein
VFAARFLDARSPPCDSQTYDALKVRYDALKVRFSSTLGEEPDIEVTLVSPLGARTKRTSALPPVGR